jgi:hypothetical protein
MDLQLIEVVISGGQSSLADFAAFFSIIEKLIAHVL